MTNDISIKDFRMRLAEIADRVEKGEAFRVIRHSKPVFMVMKINENVDEIEEWETVVDFTEGGKTTGMPIDDAIDMMDRISS
ncbi:MAG: hypothetical protein O2904_02940 [bacterium]|nr:hypothetical protein [bacterium]